MLKDEKGLCLWEITVPGKKAGETIEYAYRRKGNFKEFQTSGTEITVMYLEDDIPTGGTTAARFLNGEWKIIK